MFSIVMLYVTKLSYIYLQAVQNDYHNVPKEEFSVKCDRHSPAIEITIPTDDTKWKITPITSPAQVHMCITYTSCITFLLHHFMQCSSYSQIDMDVVLQYQPRTTIPQVTLLIEWVGKGQPTECNKRVMLTGVHAPESFVLQCIPKTTSRVWYI